jgi:hypothetical protein
VRTAVSQFVHKFGGEVTVVATTARILCFCLRNSIDYGLDYLINSCLVHYP